MTEIILNTLQKKKWIIWCVTIKTRDGRFVLSQMKKINLLALQLIYTKEFLTMYVLKG